MTANDPVRALLSARGCPAHVVSAGLPGLVEAWEGIVSAVEAEYALTLDDYLNDMDVRDLLMAALDVASMAERQAVSDRLTHADARLLAHTEPCACLWGDDIAADEGLDPTHEWWYFRRPTRPGESLREDLTTWGLLGD